MEDIRRKIVIKRWIYRNSDPIKKYWMEL